MNRRFHLSVRGCMAGLAMLATGLVHAAGAKRPATDFLSPATRAMQQNDAENPAMLWVGEGAQLWRAVTGNGKQTCAGCHGEARDSMKGVAATYPHYDNVAQRPLNLAGRINQCRVANQGLAALPREHRSLLSLESFVALQSRGLPIAPYRDARMSTPFVNGERLFRTRMGQLDLACADCHERHAGRKLAGNPIPEAHPTGYPVYRLEWQEVGSLERRIRNCMTGIRAEPFTPDSLEMIELESYLRSRASGLALDAPGVRP